MSRETDFLHAGQEISSVKFRFDRSFGQLNRRPFLTVFVPLTIGGLVVACSAGEELVDDQSSATLENLSLQGHDETRRVELDRYEQTLAGLTNSERIYTGLKPMLVDASLVELARIRSNYMASHNQFSHTQSDGKTAFIFLSQVKYPYVYAGENIAKNNLPAEQSASVAMNGFMNSQGHRDNILDPRFTHLGIGYKRDRAGMHYFTQLFAGKFI